MEATPRFRFKARVLRYNVPKTGYRWNGSLLVEGKEVGRVLLLMPGNIAHWFTPGEEVLVEACCEPRPFEDVGVYGLGDYKLTRLTPHGPVTVWPPWEREYRVEKSFYKARVRVREAVSEEDYERIAELEQHHYASKEERVAVWACPRDGVMVESNVRPRCPKCGTPMIVHEIKSSLPSSRFLILELAERRPYEPRVIGYVRVDTPIPLMHRRVVTGGGAIIVDRLIREKVFPKDWFHPTFWPITPKERRAILERFRELAKIYGRSLARTMVGHEASEKLLARVNTAAARIARVVVHPDYRGGGLGVLAVRAAVEWVRERWVPEMRRPKHIVETIAAMARFNPFFERAGFKYVWDTSSGRPVLMYPLTGEARERLERFLKEDPYARLHGGVLYKPRFRVGEKLSGPIELVGVSKGYTSELDLEGLDERVAEVLRAFGVEKRIVERVVLDNVSLTIEPGELIAVVGASGAGKTTLLRLIVGAALGIENPLYKPDSGEVRVPSNARTSVLIPGELEPSFGEGSLLEEIAKITGDEVEALEVLSFSGISDAVLYRARVGELSTGQRERARLAALLARKPNLLVIDEFTAHLDTVTAMWVAYRLSSVARRHGITVIVSSHRLEALKAMEPDKVVVVSEGKLHVYSSLGEAGLG
ncbi:MAG: GNAT family N-acetyltransferase [Desulfurococcales archaeon]|nr:GNAT family N-acetyltransferase [Desulfurococcales archaeon]